MSKNTYWIDVIVKTDSGELKQNGFGYWGDAIQWLNDLTEYGMLPSVVTMIMRTKGDTVA